MSLVVSEGTLRFVDYGTGALRSLREVSPGRYVGGPGASLVSPVRVHVRLAPGGRIAVDGRTGRLVPLVVHTARSRTARCDSRGGCCGRPAAARSRRS